MRPFERIARNIEDNIARTGRSCIGVFPDASSEDPVNEAFVYTIGNARQRMPELLIVGLCNDQGILNLASKMMIERGRAFEDGEVVSLGGKFPFVAVEAAESVKERFTVQATNFLGRSNYRVMQIVLCDKAGLFPWQAGCAEPYRSAKVHRANPLQ